MQKEERSESPRGEIKQIGGEKSQNKKEQLKVERGGTGRKQKTSQNACVISVFTSCNYGNMSAASQGQL